MTSKFNPVLSNITPKEFCLRVKHSLTISLLKNQLYLASIISDVEDNVDLRMVQRFDSESIYWDTVYRNNFLQHKDSSPDKKADFSSIVNTSDSNKPLNDSVFCCIQHLQKTNSNPESLLIFYGSPVCNSFLCIDSSRTVKEFQRIPKSWQKFFDCNSVITLNERYFGLQVGNNSTPSLLYSKAKGGSRWRTEKIPQIQPRENTDHSHIAEFNNHLFISRDNSAEGFQIWKTTNDKNFKRPDWKLVLSKGASRYVLNEKIFSMISFRNSLYIACGVEQSERNSGKFFSSTEFEVLRLYSDDDWDLVIGNPRFTPKGLKIPLSGLGPGLEQENDPAFACLVEHRSVLFLGIQNLEGFQLWGSKDGEKWNIYLQKALENHYKFSIKKALSTPMGLILFVAMFDISGNKSSEIWRIEMNS